MKIFEKLDKKLDWKEGLIGLGLTLVGACVIKNSIKTRDEDELETEEVIDDGTSKLEEEPEECDNTVEYTVDDDDFNV